MKKYISALIGILASTSALSSPKLHPSCTTQNFYGLAGHTIQAESQHDIEIYNDTDEVKRYDYSYKICVTNHGCHQKGNTAIVQPHSKWNNHADMYHVENYKNAGTYQVTATTTVGDVNHVTTGILFANE